MNYILKKPIFWLAVAVFAVSVSYSFYFQIKPAVDAKAYDRIAQNIVSGEGYRESLDVPIEKDNSIVRVGPGYEFFLAGVYQVFGRNLPAVWVIHAFLLSLASVFVYLASLKIFSELDEKRKEIASLASAALVGFSPDLVTISGMIMSETLAVFLIALSVFLFFDYLTGGRKSIWRMFALFLSLGFLAMVRTPAAFLALPVFFYFLSERRWKELVFGALVIAALFSPWVYRNYKIYGAFVPTNLAYGVDLLFGNHQGASGELEHYDLPYENIKKYGYAEGNKENAKEALRFVVDNPLEFLKITFYRVSIYFSFARPTGFWFHLEGLSKVATLALSALYSALVFILGFLGASFMGQLKEDKRAAKYLLAMAALMPVSVMFIAVETRYRFPIYPLLAVFAGYAVSDFVYDWRGWKGWKLQNALIAVFILLANTGFDGLRNLSVIFEKLNDLR